MILSNSWHVHTTSQNSLSSESFECATEWREIGCKFRYNKTKTVFSGRKSNFIFHQNTVRFVDAGNASLYENSIGEKVFFNVNIQPLILSFDEKITIAPMILFMDFVFDYFHYWNAFYAIDK